MFPSTIVGENQYRYDDVDGYVVLLPGHNFIVLSCCVVLFVLFYIDERQYILYNIYVKNIHI